MPIAVLYTSSEKLIHVIVAFFLVVKYFEIYQVLISHVESRNKSNCSSMEYSPSENDEVEDLLKLLAKVKAEYEIGGVTCGALLSDYQRIRVESVCDRLSIVNLAPLWQ